MAEFKPVIHNPAYYLYVDGNHVASLSEPEQEDMFWFSYLLTPTSESANSILRNAKTWERVSFTIKDLDGNIPNPDTFSGGYDSFCLGETNRLTFRSLVPPENKPWWRFW